MTDGADAEPKGVVVDRKCGEAVLRGSAIYAPGVLGCSLNVSIDVGHPLRLPDSITITMFSQRKLAISNELNEHTCNRPTLIDHVNQLPMCFVLQHTCRKPLFNTKCTYISHSNPTAVQSAGF